MSRAGPSWKGAAGSVAGQACVGKGGAVLKADLWACVPAKPWRPAEGDSCGVWSPHTLTWVAWALLEPVYRDSMALSALNLLWIRRMPMMFMSGNYKGTEEAWGRQGTSHSVYPDLWYACAPPPPMLGSHRHPSLPQFMCTGARAQPRACWVSTLPVELHSSPIWIIATNE